MLTRLLSHMMAPKENVYVGEHRRSADVQYEKRYDWGYAKKALGRYFEMPVHYVH